MFRILIGVAVLAAASAANAAETTKAAYEDACADARQVSQQVAAKEQRWKTTVDLLENADKAAEAGDYEKATTLCNQAEKFAEIALTQAKQQADGWRRTANLVK